jgi:DNA-binding GntR family transcriptional regulator
MPLAVFDKRETGKLRKRKLMPALEQIIDRFTNVGNAAETAYAVLREAIVTNTLKPGTRLRADELAKTLGVSKTPVREALRKLQAEDLVVVQGNGLSVKVLTEEQLLEIYYTREALEGMAARLAAENAGPIEIANLHAILDEMKAPQLAADLRQLRALTGEFQLALFRSARNETLFRLLKNLQEQIRQYTGTTLSQPGRAKEAIAYCRNVFAAVERRDADEAEKLARANRRRTLALRIRMLRDGNRLARQKASTFKPAALAQADE